MAAGKQSCALSKENQKILTMRRGDSAAVECIERITASIASGDRPLAHGEAGLPVHLVFSIDQR